MLYENMFSAGIILNIYDTRHFLYQSHSEKELSTVTGFERSRIHNTLQSCISAAKQASAVWNPNGHLSASFL